MTYLTGGHSPDLTRTLWQKLRTELHNHASNGRPNGWLPTSRCFHIERHIFSSGSLILLKFHFTHLYGYLILSSSHSSYLEMLTYFLHLKPDGKASQLLLTAENGSIRDGRARHAR
jgi:hypothetical protein